ncbi:hypothetical protein [Bradyrhizobium sp.]|uniref:hypothetical protein n=1 Tax=Bradyrhizobium sp. TaxID=376 RepID=UPI0039E3052D
MATNTQARLVVTTNAAECGKWLRGQSKKILQAGKAALAQTILQVQQAERRELRRDLHIRKTSFMDNRIRISHFPRATADGLIAVIGINDRVQGTPLFLAGLEDANTPRRPLSGNAVAVPITGTKARPVIGKNVPASMRINRLSIQKNGGAYRGRKGTFILPTKGGGHVVFQRTGRGAKSEVSPIYVFKKNIRLRRRLRFVPIAAELAYQQLPRLYTRYLRLYIK